MFKRVPYYMAALIGGYLLLKYYKGAVADANSASTGATNIIKALQAR